MLYGNELESSGGGGGKSHVFHTYMSERRHWSIFLTKSQRVLSEYLTKAWVGKETQLGSVQSNAASLVCM